MTQQRKALTLFDDYHAMMSDPVRSKAYRKAIAQVVQPNDVVVDLGAGLGILSLLALRAGAKRVYAIEHGHAAKMLEEIARINNVSDKMVILAGNSKDIRLPERADVLLSETLGSFAVDENTLDFTLDARERFLKEDARLLPRALRLYLAPVHAPIAHQKIAYWGNVEGFDFSAAQRECVSRMSLFDVDKRGLLAKPALYAEVDLRVDDTTELEHKVLFEIERKSVVHGLAGWFEADLSDDVTLVTSPQSKSTHWRQAFFPFVDPVSVVRGDYMEVTLSVKPQEDANVSSHSDNTTIAYTYRCTQRAG